MEPNPITKKKEFLAWNEQSARSQSRNESKWTRVSTSRSSISSAFSRNTLKPVSKEALEVFAAAKAEWERSGVLLTPVLQKEPPLSARELSPRKLQNSRLIKRRNDPILFENGFQVCDQANESSLSLSQEYCNPAYQPVKEAARRQDHLYDELLRELSLRTLSSNAAGPALQASHSSLQAGKDIQIGEGTQTEKGKVLCMACNKNLDTCVIF